MYQTIRTLRVAVLVGGLIGLGVAPSWAQSKAETFTATGSVQTKGGAKVTVPVTVTLTGMTTDAQRDAVVAALKKGGTDAVVAALKGMSDVGSIQVGERKTVAKYAYARPTSGGRIVTVIAPTPIAHLGAGLPDAAPKTGFDLSIVVLEVQDAGAGNGELVPAATLKVTETGAIQTKDYGAEAVQLTNVRKK
jgi:hypothetical protein